MAQSLKWCLMALLMLSSLTAGASGSLQVTRAGSDEPLDQVVVEIDIPGLERPVRAQGHYEISQHQAAFEPLVTLMPAGAAASFPNRDTTRHQVFSFSPPKVFSLDLYLRETPPPVHFETSGVEVLGCNIHDQMQAFIVISKASFFAMTDKSGRIALDQLPPGRYPMRIWHPRLENTHQQWWKGEIDTRLETRIALTLAASPPPMAEPSLLQQRFQHGLMQREHP